MSNALYVAWRSGPANTGVWGPVGRLSFDGKLYRFCYTRGARSLHGFRAFPQMDDLQQEYQSEDLFPLFANRILSPSRPEYEAFLRWGGFLPTSPPDPIAILGVTEGIRQTDLIEVFPCPVPDPDGAYVCKFFLHGIRWMPPATVERIGRLEQDENLLLMPDPLNESDPDAVAVRTDRERTLIGYVPRYLAGDVLQLLYDCDCQSIELSVERVNLDAPLQHRVLCRMRACWPDSFEPCGDEAFLPIPRGVSAQREG